MRRIAFFVEGKTERLFVTRLLKEAANEGQLLIDEKTARGGGKTGKPLIYTQISATRATTNEKYYALIVDCGSEDNVKVRLHGDHSDLTNKGYERIVGIRDVRPTYDRTSVDLLRKKMRAAINKQLAPVSFVFPLMEIEAWFLAEHSHFIKIAPEISLPAIQQALGFNPETDDMSERDTPADDLHDCYQLAGFAYKKTNAMRTVNALDMTFMWADLAERVPALRHLVRIVNDFLGLPPPPQATLADLTGEVQ